ncbi:unnamed protein product [Polarella glacialis]|uniref:Uncharacterized protein n=1 Tax=Polarella glacialis TaxID=89957 RepID=A0A813EEU4_POLGL|nr:unnamed protein product [Polarella glacialis]
MAGIPAGSVLAVRYNVGGRHLFHERVVTKAVAGRRFHLFVLTPDGQHYDEDYEDLQDIAEVLVLNQLGDVPLGMAEADFYRFRAVPTAGALALLQAQAEAAVANDPLLAAGAIVQAGGGLPGGGAAHPAAVPPVALPIGGAPMAAGGAVPAGPAGVPAGAGVLQPFVGHPALLAQWRVAASEAGLEVGEVVAPGLVPAGTGSKRIAMVNGCETFIELVSDDGLKAWIEKRLPLDVRIQRIKIRHGARCREWREGCEELREETFTDYPLTGPRTSSWCMKYLNRQPGGAADRHALWRQGSKVSPSDWGVAEHETLLEAVKLAMSYDQLELANLACFEILFRRLQTIEYCYQDRSRELSNSQHQRFGPKLTLEEQSAFMGVTRNEMVMIDPQLLAHIKSHVKEDAELSKNLRLAREERAAALKHKGKADKDLKE